MALIILDIHLTTAKWILGTFSSWYLRSVPSINSGSWAVKCHLKKVRIRVLLPFLSVLHSLPIPELHHYNVSDAQSAPLRLKSQKKLVPSLKRWFTPTYRRKHQSSTELDVFMVIQQLPLDSPHNGPVTWKIHTHIYIYIWHDITMLWSINEKLKHICL